MKSKIDSLNTEFTELSAQLSGINPKLSSYGKIRERMNEIVKELGGGHRIMYTKLKKTRKGKRYLSSHQFVHG